MSRFRNRHQFSARARNDFFIQRRRITEETDIPLEIISGIFNSSNIIADSSDGVNNIIKNEQIEREAIGYWPDLSFEFWLVKGGILDYHIWGKPLINFRFEKERPTSSPEYWLGAATRRGARTGQ
jgi:hypothetical protein